MLSNVTNVSLQSIALFCLPFAVLLVITGTVTVIVFLQINIFVNFKNVQISFLKISLLQKL